MKRARSIDELIKELLVSMRGPRTQAEASKRLGYSFNIVSKWETGARKIYWSDFVDLCKVCDQDLKGALTEHLGYRGDPRATKTLLTNLTEGTSPKEVCVWLGASRASLGRWLNGQGEPPLSILLSLIDKVGRLSSFVEQLAVLEMSPAMKALNQSQIATRDVFATFPEAAAFLCALELRRFSRMRSHPPGCFAKTLGISKRREASMIAALLDCQLLGLDGKRYVPLTRTTDIAWTSKESFEKTKKAKLHWFEAGLSTLRKDQFDRRTCRSGYDVFGCTPASREKIETEISRFNRRIFRILEEAKDETEAVCVLQYQLMDVCR